MHLRQLLQITVGKKLINLSEEIKLLIIVSGAKDKAFVYCSAVGLFDKLQRISPFEILGLGLVSVSLETP